MLRNEVSLSKRLQQGQQMAENLFTRYGGMPLTAAIYPSTLVGEELDRVLMVVSQDVTEAHKTKFRKAVVELMKSEDADAVAVIAEAWIFTPESPDNRREALVVTMETASESAVAFAPILRQHGKPKLGAWETFPSALSAGGLAGFFPKTQLLN